MEAISTRCDIAYRIQAQVEYSPEWIIVVSIDQIGEYCVR